VDFVPDDRNIEEAATLEKASEIVKARVVPRSALFDAVVLDDFSLMVTNTRDAMQARWKGDGRQMYGLLGQKVLEFVELCRTLKCHVVFNTHLKYPADGEPGGPALPGQLLHGVPKLCDMVLRVDADPTRRPWPACYRAGLWAGADWITKDRHHVVVDRGPMNLAELLRAAGYVVARAPGLDAWQEDAVAAIADGVLVQKKSENQMFQDIGRVLLASGVTRKQIEWTFRDARDRIEITRSRANSLTFGFGVTL
jgi:hypothetical protein